MRRPTTLLRVLKETGPLIAVVVAGLFLLGLAIPAGAQFFPFFGGGGQPQRQAPRGGGGFFGGDSPFFSPFERQQPRRQAPREDFSRAPQSDKRDSPAERNVLVLGDSMADWLGYGLDEAYAEQPDMGVIRKHKTVSGLIRYQPKGEPSDWAAAAKGILATENPSAIVVMLGLQDRVSLREPAADKPGEKKAARSGKPDDKPDADAADDDIADPSPIIAPERGTRTLVAGTIEFREERWVELYAKKIDEMIAVVKAKGVPVLWVGLPAVRGIKATFDMLFLNGLYRAAADKAGITYVDIWDGFVDEAGRFIQQGPDFEGQSRRLRSYDGVYFTKAGARKLAHYTEREITRLLQGSRDGPVTLPSDTTGPEVEVKPDGPAPRPLAGPILPLVVAAVNSDQLLGGPGARPVSADATATRLMVRGEPLDAPPGRADDAAWPRREVGRETAPRGGDMPVAAVTPDGNAASVLAAPAAQKAKQRPRPQIVQQQQPAFPGFFNFGGQQQAPQPQRPRNAPGPRQQTGFTPPSGFSGFFR